MVNTEVITSDRAFRKIPNQAAFLATLLTPQDHRLTPTKHPNFGTIRQAIPLHVNPVEVFDHVDVIQNERRNHLLVSENNLYRTQPTLLMYLFREIQDRRGIFTARELDAHRVERVIDVTDPLASSL